MRRTIALTTTLLAALALTASPAYAAAPSNDTRAGAVTIGALPFSASLDTSAATTDAQDDALNAQCGAPATTNSVWYSYTAPEGIAGITVSVADSSYLGGVIVAEGDVVVACGPDAVGTPVSPGTTYTILAFGDTPGQAVGTLRLSVTEATIPKLDVTVDPRAKVDRQGNALVTGTYTCTGGDGLDLYVNLKQSVGRFAVIGDGASFGACDGTYPWSATVVPFNGKFAGGKAAAVTFSFACGSAFCSDSYVERVIKLSK